VQKIVVFATSYLDNIATDPSGADEGVRILERVAAESGGELAVEYRCERDPNKALQASELDEVRAVIADLERYDGELLQRVGRKAGGPLELIARYGVGVDSVDLAAATEAGVVVANTPGANTTPTAEWAVATLLDVAGRRIPHHQQAAAGYGKSGPSRIDVSGKTLGIIGTGRIGRTVAQLLSGFSPSLLAYDPYPNEAWAAEVGAKYVDLDTLCGEADLITLHAASGEQLLGARELALMSSTTVLVNCARGVLVDNREAYRAVREGRLFGYGIDEIWPEPDLDVTGLNIAASPHVGADTDRGKRDMRIATAEAVAAHISGNRPASVVNPEVYERLG
jgi:phosphoglycerate dehydrogenase-like enzyme